MMINKFKVKNLKLKIVFLLLAFLLFTLPSSVSAHLIGQPPFLKINEKYANLYPVPLTSLYNFDLPQDLAPDNYLVNQSINFELDITKLPAPPEIVMKTKFDWDFTDGTHSQGLKLAHTFTKIGSYIVKIYADDGTTPKPQLLESVLINVLPDKNYQLPQAKIWVNNKESKDSLTDILQADFKKNLTLDGSKSTTSDKLLEYFWDFGDQKSFEGVSQTHKYPDDLSQVFVVLRVKDNNGFLTDSFVEVQNTQNSNQNNSSPSAKTSPTLPQSNKPSQMVFVLIGVIFFAGLIFMARQLLQGRGRAKRQ